MVCFAMAGLLPVVIQGRAAAVVPCSRTVVFATPGVTWSDVRHSKPPGLLSLAKRGAIGSMSVHTVVSRPSYSSAFATIGAGARMPSLEIPRPRIASVAPGRLSRNIRVTSPSRLRALAARSGYGAKAGALADALPTPTIAVGNSDTTGSPTPAFTQWPLLAAMGSSGRVQYAAVGTNLLRSAVGPIGLEADAGSFVAAARKAFSLGCATVVIDTGDLERAQQAGSSARALSEALTNTDRVLRSVSKLLDLRRDLLLVISPTSPTDVTHLGLAIAVGPEFRPGSLLESASTRRPGIVTLPDVAPTVLAHAGVPQPAVMNGQTFFSVPGEGDRIAAAAALDREAVFIDAAKPTMSWVFLLAEAALFVAAITAVRTRSHAMSSDDSILSHLVTIFALGVASLPVATFVAKLLPAADLGRVTFIALCLLIDAALVALVSRRRFSPLQRLALVAAVSLVVILSDLATGAHLQLNSLLGDSPLIAGRFAGAGNNAFAIMAVTAVVCATVLVWQQGQTRTALIEAAVLFAAVILIDGAPQFGSDVGGVLALVPGFAVTWMLLARKGISLKLVVLGLAAAIVCAGVFVAIDVGRPPKQRTHLGRFFEDIRSRGGSAFVETVQRKAASNLRQAGSLQNLYRFLPAAAITLYFLFWPSEWWNRLGAEQPLLRAGAIGGLVVALLGSALNDSGITIFTTMLLFLAPMTILIRLSSRSPDATEALGAGETSGR